MSNIPEGYVPYWLDAGDALWPRIKPGRRLVHVKKGRIWMHIIKHNGTKTKIKVEKWDALHKEERDVSKI
jgi:hypothetical protein